MFFVTKQSWPYGNDRNNGIRDDYKVGPYLVTSGVRTPMNIINGFMVNWVYLRTYRRYNSTYNW